SRSAWRGMACPRPLLDQGSQLRQHLINDEIGSPFDEPRLAGLQIENARLVAEHDALCPHSGSAQRNGETGMPGKRPTLRDRADQRGSEYVEGLRGDDQHITGTGLLAALDGVQVDVVNVAPLHL